MWAECQKGPNYTDFSYAAAEDKNRYNRERKKVQDGEEIISHYVAVINFGRLMRQYSTNQDNHAKTFCCHRCISFFPNEKRLAEHLIDCKKQDVMKITMCTDENKYITFTQKSDMLQVPYYIVADSESCLIPFQEQDEEKNTKRLQKHESCSFGFKVVCQDPEEQKEFKYEQILGGAEEFMGRLIEVYEDLLVRLKKNETMTGVDTERHNNTWMCHICKKTIKKYDNDRRSAKQTNYKVRDHCHVTGQYRGPAHNECNRKFYVPRKINVFFHNLKNYDSHPLILACKQLK